MVITQYDKILPERIKVLDQIKKIIINNKLFFRVHKKINYAGNKLETISVVINPNKKETFLIVAGCHGNEPAPIYAVKDYLKKNKFPKNKKIIIVYCLNTYGFCNHKSKNENNININRDFLSKNPQKETKIIKYLVKKYKPSFTLTLHEDPDQSKFFIYLEGNVKNKAKKILSIASKHLPYYKKKIISKNKVIKGIIYGSISKNTLETFLINKNIPNICIETPGICSLDKRIKVHKEILGNLKKIL